MAFRKLIVKKGLSQKLEDNVDRLTIEKSKNLSRVSLVFHFLKTKLGKILQ